MQNFPSLYNHIFFKVHINQTLRLHNVKIMIKLKMLWSLTHMYMELNTHWYMSFYKNYLKIKSVLKRVS